MRVLNGIWVALFSLSAILQYNDPDPYVWMPIYGFGAFLCYKAMQWKWLPALYVLAFALYVPYAVYLFFGPEGVLSWWQEHEAENIAQSMKATKPWIEATREFFGLLLLILALLLNVVWFRRLSKTGHAEDQGLERNMMNKSSGRAAHSEY